MSFETGWEGKFLTCPVEWAILGIETTAPPHPLFYPLKSYNMGWSQSSQGLYKSSTQIVHLNP